MQAAKEYFKAAQTVSILTKPLLIYYGMVNLAKVLHITGKGEVPEGKKHGLESIKPWNGILSYSVKVKSYGIFPELYHCYSNEELGGSIFSLKQLLSQIPEIKIPFETVYKEKSLAVKAIKVRYGVNLVDSELEKYSNLQILMANTPKLKYNYNGAGTQTFQGQVNLFTACFGTDDAFTQALSGEKYLILPLSLPDGTYRILPEISTHFLIMFMLGMTARYHPKIWAEIIRGQDTGEIYVIQNFLNVTARKFPNLILNELRNRKFFFCHPKS